MQTFWDMCSPLFLPININIMYKAEHVDDDMVA